MSSTKKPAVKRPARKVAAPVVDQAAQSPGEPAAAAAPQLPAFTVAQLRAELLLALGEIEHAQAVAPAGIITQHFSLAKVKVSSCLEILEGLSHV